MKYILLSLFSLFSLTVANYNILSFSGGGSFGAVEVGIIKKIQETDAKKYDLITGISAGGLNAGFLSHFVDLNVGIKEVSNIYSNLKNNQVYELYPPTKISVYNTEPLKKTISNIINKFDKVYSKTLIGTTNLYTGQLDKYYYNELDNNDQISLLMCTSAIPIMFPPIQFNNNLYVDGGEISNELVTNIYSPLFINVTFITYTFSLENNYNLTTFSDIVKRNFQIVTNTFNNEILKLDQSCTKPRGEINMYYVNSDLLKNYNMLDFETGKDLINIGYNNVLTTKYKLC